MGNQSDVTTVAGNMVGSGFSQGSSSGFLQGSKAQRYNKTGNLIMASGGPIHYVQGTDQDPNSFFAAPNGRPSDVNSYQGSS